MLLKKGVKTKIVGIIKNLKILRFKVSFFVILNIEGLSKTSSDGTLFDNININLNKGDKIAVISKNSKVILVEGNYVLLNSYPWKQLHKFFNATIMINCDEKILEKRLIERWENFNLPKEEIDKKVYENDLPNGINVLKNSIEADYILLN